MVWLGIVSNFSSINFILRAFPLSSSPALIGNEPCAILIVKGVYEYAFWWCPHLNMYNGVTYWVFSRCYLADLGYLKLVAVTAAQSC